MKLSVVLFQFGSPLTVDEIRPFLYDMFVDPAIVSAPAWFRKPLASWLAGRRFRKTKAIFERMGGPSPLLEVTKEQARLVETELSDLGDVRCFIAMRYGERGIAQALEQSRLFRPDITVFLPLYPQYSRVTTGSSFSEADRHITRQDKVVRIEAYPDDQGFVQAMGMRLMEVYPFARACGPPRVLFSAHGIPLRLVRQGDPYPAHCQRTVDAIKAFVGRDDMDSVLCYQSRMGPLRWTGPSTADEIRKAAQRKAPVIIVPISFVSENTETLVELAQDGQALAVANGAPFFACLPTVGTSEPFIQGLAAQVRKKVQEAASVYG